jgi:ERCC4-type nuclease
VEKRDPLVVCLIVLQSSILDGRYEEQKFRLRQMRHHGIQHVVVIVEGNVSRCDRPQEAQAAIISMLAAGVHVKLTASFDDTLKFIVHLSKYLQTGLR